jgi:ribonuclease HII
MLEEGNIVTVQLIDRLHEGADGDSAYAGIDEVGVDSIAGPMVAAVVILPANHGIPRLPIDSKKLEPHDIQEMAAAIEPVVRFAWIGALDTHFVDALGPHEARSRLWQAAAAAVRAVLPAVPIVIDGQDPIPGVDNQTAIVAADDTHDAVSAAAMLAKAHCDRAMIALDALYPGYQFAKQKGYAKRDSLIALRDKGLSPVHRRRMAEKALSDGIPEEKLDLPLEDIQALLADLLDLLDAHPGIAGDWELEFVRSQRDAVMVRGRRPSGRQQHFLVEKHGKLTHIARKKGLISTEKAEEYRRRRHKARPPSPRPPADAAPRPPPPPREPGFIARNGPCPCGSGHKYKRCCAPDAVAKRPSEP